MSDNRWPATLVCASNVEPEQLSAWRDGLLSSDQATWLAQHTAGCPACSERLRDYERIGSDLRSQMIPRPNSDLWPGTQRLIANGGKRGLRLPGGLSRGSWGAVVAATLLIALFAGLLVSHLPQRGAGSATATVAPNPTATATTAATATTPGVAAWTQVANLSQATNPPASWRTSYTVFSGQDSKTSAPTFSLKRTDDFGQTWVDLTPPQISGVTYPNSVNYATGAMSPLDPKVYVLTLVLSTSTCPQSNGGPSGRYCQVQYVTTDSGASWRLLQLPLAGTLGVSLPLLQGSARAEQLQGTRLFSVVNTVMLGASGAIPPGRLVASDDGGATWTLVDGALHTQGLSIYDFSATTTGSTVYALAGADNSTTGAPGQLPPLALWRSDNGGASWSQIGALPGSVVNDVLASRDANSGKTTVYLLAGDGAKSPGLYASQDGGAHWTNSGLSGATLALLAALPNGSLFLSTQNNAQAWDGNSGAPRVVGQATGLSGPITTAVQSGAGGAVTVWLSGSGQQGAIQEYLTFKP